MPPAINWSQELANLRQEIADPLVPVHPDLPGLATRHTPPDDQDAHEDQHRIMRCWHANASGLRAKVEGPLVYEGPLGNPQGLWASHTAQRKERARSTLFSLLFFSSRSLEPNPARFEASVHSSLDLKHFTAGEH